MASGGDISRVFCHACNAERDAIAANSSESETELTCLECGGNFVEILGQGIDEFLHPSESTSPSISSSISGESNRDENSNNSAAGDPLLQLLSGVFGNRGDSLGNMVNQLLINSQVQRQQMQQLQQQQQQLHQLHNQPQLQPPQPPQQPPLLSELLGGIINTIEMHNGNNNGMQQTGHRMRRIMQNSMFMPTRFLNGNQISDDANFESILHHILMHEQSHAGVAPLSQTVIDAFHRELVTAETDIASLGECNISFEAFEVGDIAVTLPCNHRFKEDQISKWLKMHGNCPVCRVPLDSNNCNNNNNTMR